MSTSFFFRIPPCDYQLWASSWKEEARPSQLWPSHGNRFPVQPLYLLFYFHFLDLQVYQVQRHATDWALPSGPLLCFCARGE